ncbi:serine/threonine-protein kinase [Nocardia anaemiae]|uniref:serine/threonine-protein kinase n=1 Tax=Nocardia anaemiae TaxID=263910 RepID=UPI0007A50D72|nr:serine/threonine-protein kinase [Nocardia anaemiae]
MTFVPGTVFAGYIIERVLGAGGMGTVYVARHPRLPRRDALKVLSDTHSGDGEFRARFIREAELAARLDHPNIVAVHDRGVAEGHLWIAMQFIDGFDAAALIRRGAAELPPERAVHIVVEAARGLDAAHQAGLLHRDVKPGNILLHAQPGQPDRVLVTDFGIARSAGQATVLTEVGSVLATLAYAAPEQLMAGVVDHRADVYALGCTLHELLTGTKPFPRDSTVAVMQAHIQDTPPRPTAMNPALPPAIDDVVARAMAKNPDHRFPSCGALADAAVAALHGRPTEPAPPIPPPARKSRRKFAVAGVVGAVIVALAIVGAVALRGGSSGRSSGLAAPVPSTSMPSAISATGTASWGNYSYMAQAFPALLPSSPFSSGYQGIRCVAVDANDKPVDVNRPAAAVGHLSCTGNRDPVVMMLLSCNTNRDPSTVQPFTDAVTVGDEHWQRSFGDGRLIWSDTTTAPNDPNGGNRPMGVMQVQFDDPARKFCRLQVYGGNSGRDLHDRWWPDAPI